MHTWQKYNAIRNSNVIICISENTKNDLLRYVPDISEDKIHVIYNGVSEDYFPVNNKNFAYSDYILFVGGRQEYKNFRYAVNCVKEVNKKLLIVGSELTSKELDFVKHHLGEEGYLNIVHPNNSELNIIYNSVDCLLYPSLYEGFGIPVIEAQKAGCPVIAMNSSSIPEIIGREVDMLNEASISEFKRIYYILCSNRIDIISEGLDNSKRFSWNKMTKEYFDIYKELSANV